MVNTNMGAALFHSLNVFLGVMLVELCWKENEREKRNRNRTRKAMRHFVLVRWKSSITCKLLLMPLKEIVHLPDCFCFFVCFSIRLLNIFALFSSLIFRILPLAYAWCFCMLWSFSVEFPLIEYLFAHLFQYAASFLHYVS